MAVLVNTDPKCLRNGGRKADSSTSLQDMMAQEWARYQIEQFEEGYLDQDDMQDWDITNPPDDTYSFIYYLVEKLKSDLKVKFDTENSSWGMDFGPTSIEGYQRLSNGLEYFGISAGGDWECPVFFIVYTDGKKLRAYIPTYGNTFNADLNTAFGSETESDKFDACVAKYRKKYPNLYDPDDEEEFLNKCFLLKFNHYVPDDWLEEIDFDTDKIIEDIESRIEVI